MISSLLKDSSDGLDAVLGKGDIGIKSKFLYILCSTYEKENGEWRVASGECDICSYLEVTVIWYVWRKESF
jgi:hypothetical protein